MATMRAVRFLLAAVLFVAACGVRTPPALDVAALVRARGPVDAHRELIARVLAHPRDVQARLALATLADQLGRPSEAIEQLEAVERLGGPLGTRWHAGDRARLGRLLLARGRVRLARGAATALADLERAASLGAPATAEELARARIAIAIGKLVHVDGEVRAEGRAMIAAVQPGAKPSASPAERGAFGVWLWQLGARREAYEQLVAWHDATPPPRDEALQGAYLRALAWWSPVWLDGVKQPPVEELVGPERCWFPAAACAPPVSEAAPLPPLLALDVEPRVAAAVRYAATRFAGEVATDELVRIARAFGRDPAIAERLGRDLVASAPDGAIASAILGALFDALGDPARARAAWQAAIDASAEPAFVWGLAEAAARTGDGPAALVFATRASAAWGDPAVVWTSVAEVLVGAGQLVDGLTAARTAIDLAGPEVLPRALDVAIDASRALGRTAQADARAAQRARLDGLGKPAAGDGEGDARSALAAHRERPTASTIAQLWVASRARPRDIEVRAALMTALGADDPRRRAIAGELLALAGDPDTIRALAAVSALRR